MIQGPTRVPNPKGLDGSFSEGPKGAPRVSNNRNIGIKENPRRLRSFERANKFGSSKEKNDDQDAKGSA